MLCLLKSLLIAINPAASLGLIIGDNSGDVQGGARDPVEVGFGRWQALDGRRFGWAAFDFVPKSGCTK